MKLILLEDYDQISDWAANYVCKKIKEFKPSANKIFNLGLPTGSTPVGLYKKLIKLCQEGLISFKYVQTFNMDEYVNLPETHPQSYHYFMNENFFNHIDIDAKNINFLNGNAANLNLECEEYEAKIKKSGGIHLFIGGMGSDGHIAFNEPGSSLCSRTRMKTLTIDTIKANSRFFDFDCEKVPKQALTVGVSTIMDANEVLILVSGIQKSRALYEAIECGISQMCTSSILQLHPKSIFVCDDDSILELKYKTVKYHKSLMQAYNLF